MENKTQINKNRHPVSLKNVVEEFALQVIYTPKDLEDLYIDTPEIIRPGLMLAGFTEVFDSTRVSILGKAEISYINTLDDDLLKIRLEGLVKVLPPLIIIARNLEFPTELINMAQKYHVPICVSSDETAQLVSSMFAYLNRELAPRCDQHGVLLEVYGTGILIMGESGVGKSETAIELVKRGHRLVADDLVEIRRISAKKLVGTSPENIRHFLEIRGIGIINARQIFGTGAVKIREDISLVVKIEQWNNEKEYDRLGLETQYTEILGVNVPQLTIPIKPGRNLAVIIEVAAMNYRQKLLGYNAAEELLTNLGMS